MDSKSESSCESESGRKWGGIEVEGTKQVSVGTEMRVEAGDA